MRNDCQCDIPEGGYCARHGIRKPAHWVERCRTKENWWMAWEEGRGPGQSRKAPAERVRRAGWGDKVEAWLKKAGITPERYTAIKAKFGLPPTCGCARRREWINNVERWLKQTLPK